MTDTPKDLIAPESVERLAQRLDGAHCASGCGTMAFCMCAYAADCVDTLRALSAERDALIEARDMLGGWWEKEKSRAEAAEAENARLREAGQAVVDEYPVSARSYPCLLLVAGEECAGVGPDLIWRIQLSVFKRSYLRV